MAKKITANKEEREKRNNVWELSEYARKELFIAKRAELPKYIKKRKKQLIKELEEYDILATDDEGNAIVENSKIPMIDLWDFCFSPFVKVAGAVPDYSASELSIIFDYYKDCIKRLNNVKIFPPTKEQFCTLCGFSTQRFNELKNTSPNDIREILLQVEDYIANYLNIGGLTRKTSEVTGIFIQKSSLGRKEATEQQGPPPTNNIVIGDSAFAELCGKFGIKEK